MGGGVVTLAFEERVQNVHTLAAERLRREAAVSTGAHRESCLRFAAMRERLAADITWSPREEVTS